MNISRLRNSFEKITWLFWLGLVLALPVTSMPLVAKLIHSSAVAPASLIFLGLLCVTWLPVYLKNKGTFPFPSRIILLFLLVGLISSGVSLLSNVPVYKDETVISNVASGLVTLCLGILFYLVSSACPNSSEKIKSTLCVLNWGGCIMLGWAVLVFVIDQILTPGADTPDYLRSVQHIFSTTTFFGARWVGFASEPSWFAHLLNMVYLPYWISATFTNFTAHSKKMWKFSIENGLLVVGFIALFMTYSRAGLAAFILVLGFYFIRFNIWMIKKIKNRISSAASQKLVTIALILVFIAVYIGIALGCVYMLSKIDPRMENVFSIEIIRQGGLVKYADYLKFGERVTYWQAGWNIFNAHPLIGVGQGNAGFYFPQFLPDNAWNLSEVRGLIYRSSSLLNIKSLWVRILAETGLIGFSVFLIFLTINAFIAAQLTRSHSSVKKTLGLMGAGMLVAFLLEGFSVDSFALPYIWFTLGLLAAAWRWIEPGKEEDITIGPN